MNRLSLRAALLLLLSTLLIAPAAPRAQAPDKGPDQLRTLSRDELDVIKVLTQQERAWNRGDLDGFATGYKNSSDILFIGHQISRGYAGMLADYRTNYPSKEAMGTLGFMDLEPHILDVLADSRRVRQGNRKGQYGDSGCARMTRG